MTLEEKDRLRREKKFIEKAQKLHNNKYDYSKLHYIDLKSKILIICPIHGEVSMLAGSHLRNSGCIECGKQNRINSFREAKKKNKGPWGQKSRNKAANTNLEKYGAKTWAESDIGHETARKRCEPLHVRKQMSRIAKSEISRNHYKETSMKNWGAKHWTQSKKGNKILRDKMNTPEERKNRSERMLSPEVKNKIQNTCMKRYGAPYYWQSDEGRKRLKILLNDEAVIKKTEETNLRLYGNKSWVASEEGRKRLSEISLKPEVLLKRIETKKRNGTINDSKPEKEAYSLLVQKFGKFDIECQYRSDERYPFKCDFYVKSVDVFIELNLFWMHGEHWFDENNYDDVSKLNHWLSKNQDSYKRAIYVWTYDDLRKRDCAIKNNLNYQVFWDNDLNDFKEWLNKQ